MRLGRWAIRAAEAITQRPPARRPARALRRATRPDPGGRGSSWRRRSTRRGRVTSRRGDAAPSMGTSATMRPGRDDITSTRSATKIASWIECVTSTTVVPVAAHRPSSSALSRSRVSASRALNGSSSSSTDGSSASARASAARWRIPPESWCGRACSKPSSPTRSDEFGRSPVPDGLAGCRRVKGECHVLHHVAPGQEARLLEHEPDARVGSPDGELVDADLAAIGREQPADDAQQRALAGTVGADDGHDLAAGHRECHAVEREQTRAARHERA